jgi:superfamily II DNA or RNA helicase
MIQSLVRKGQVDDIVAGYGHVIVDECHHIPAYSFERVLSEVKARFITGLTATPQRRDGHQPITRMQLGPVRFAVDPKSQSAKRPFDHRLIVRETGFGKGESKLIESIQEIYAALAVDDRRNRLIFDDVLGALEEGRSPILLTERRDHLEYFADRLKNFARNLIVLRGGMGIKDRREVLARLAAIPAKDERLVLATGRYIGEGFDDARLDTLFLAMPVSWKGTLVQYTGRLHRLHPGKTEVRIYDYVDREVPMLLRMFERRLRGYRAIGYARDESPLGLREVEDELVIEYDEDVLHELERMKNS